MKEENANEIENVSNEVVDSTPVGVVVNDTFDDDSDIIEEPKKKKTGFIACLLLIIILVLGYVFVYPILNKSGKPTSTKTSQENKNVYSEYRITGNALDNFDLYFLKLENEEKNKVYSPLSIKYALEMLAEGAGGETKEQIDNIIGDYSAKKYPNNDHMSFANAMFIRNSFKDSVKSEYTSTLSSKYNAEVIYDEFTSPDNINNWVSNKTFNLINNLIDDVSQNDFFLINALAIDMNWNNQIHCTTGNKIPCLNGRYYGINYSHEKLDDDSTMSYGVTEYPYDSDEQFYGNAVRKHSFNGKEGIKGGDLLADFNKYDIIKDLGEDKIKEIIKPEYEEWLKTDYGKDDKPFDEFIDGFIDELKENYGKAANSTDFLLYEDDNVKEFAKDLQTYDDTTLQYIGIMPKNEKLADFIDKSDKDSLNKIINGLKEVKIDNFEEGYVTRIRGYIPFFKFDYQLKLKEDLKALGIEDIFDSEKADLSNMTGSKGAFIDRAIHKADIEFSNDGIKAAAATALAGFGAASGPVFEHLFKVPVKDIDISFNKPYMYIIRDKVTGEVWFAGTVYEPIQK